MSNRIKDRTQRVAMCATSAWDLEEIPLDDDDPNSLEFKILAFYAKHHVFKNPPAASSPRPPRTRSLSQRGLGSWPANDSWTQVSWAWRTSPSPEQATNLGKKKSSWRALFGVVEKEENEQSPPTARLEGQAIPELHGPSHSRARSLSNMGQHREREAEDPQVVSIANRVAEIVHSWPPADEVHGQAGSRKSKGSFVHPFIQRQGFQLPAPSAKKDGEEQIIAQIVELLKYSGDQLERELKKDKALMNSFQDQLCYPVFKIITDQFLRGVDTRGESEVRAQGFKAALAIDVTAKLTAIDNHPMNRVLGFGTKYLKDNFSPWVQQHGGWEKVLGISHEEVD
ncbi:apoptosis facilitator Bcl-2-like protein 14 isoform X2 [Acinonyx jubatus]|uniref:Apoptosis facilitator Bcl-2-like protein 14 isoform X2 n=2 Tax=Acinonyx jubatus TaxID=32536 RepID=A0A6I9ZCI4_ACIJB|nr:apoptosis facilitator Bcl-2-like protein 14 isoform X2 [Acinonyx jubatus]